MTHVNEFERKLIERRHVTALPSDLVNEGDLEGRVLLPIVQHDFPQRGDPSVQHHEGGETWVPIGNPG